MHCAKMDKVSPLELAGPHAVPSGHTAGTAGRLLSDDNKLLPYNIEHETGKPKYTMSNNGERVPQTRLR